MITTTATTITAMSVSYWAGTRILTAIGQSCTPIPTCQIFITVTTNRRTKGPLG